MLNAIIRLALIGAAACGLLARAEAAPCTHEPPPGGDPTIAAALALKIDLCRERSRPVADTAALVVQVAQSGLFNIEFGAWSFDLDRATLKIVSASAAAGERVDSFRQRTGAAFAINGGFFDFGPQRELRPVGLFIENGRAQNSLGKALSGTLLIAGRRVEILETGTIGSLQNYRFALQSKPLLVDPGNRLGMRGNDGVRVPRSAVCLTDAKHVVFFYGGGTGLSLFEMATLLQAPPESGGFGCNVALNLDGGPSTQVSAESGGATFERLGQNVANAVVVVAGR